MHRISLIVAVTVVAIGITSAADAYIAFNGTQASGLSRTNQQLNGLRFGTTKVVEPQVAPAKADAPAVVAADQDNDQDSDQD